MERMEDESEENERFQPDYEDNHKISIAIYVRDW